MSEYNRVNELNSRCLHPVSTQTKRFVSEPTPLEVLNALRAKQIARYESGDLPASDALVGASPPMVRLRAQVSAAVQSGATVLISGGEPQQRYDIALAIHFQSAASASRSLVTYDAASSLPGEFHQRLTSILNDQPVAGTQATPTTLVIESLEHLPAELQADLLLAKNDAKWQVQLIATCGDEPTPAAGTTSGISDELLAAVSTIAIAAPALSDRIEDVPQLAEWHVETLNRTAEREIDRFSSDALDRLMLYDWPGGLPEFGEVVAAAHNQCQAIEIAAADLPLVVHQAVKHLQSSPKKPQPIDLDKYLSDVESLLVTRALQLAGGNKAEAARLLGVSRPRLYRKLAHMGLADPIDTKPRAPKQPTTPAEPTPPTASEIEFLPIEPDGELERDNDEPTGSGKEEAP